MNAPVAQRSLEQVQKSDFRHGLFAAEQLADFTETIGVIEGEIVDVGGGCGFFAAKLGRRFPMIRASIIDTDPEAVSRCLAAGLNAEFADALTYSPKPGQKAACFNLILHHLVGSSEAETRALQVAALRRWAGKTVFVNEYIYEGWLGDAPGRLIYAITSSRLLSAIGRAVSRLIPSLRANTFGVGVRFRSVASWERLFREAGFATVQHHRGQPETVSPARRLLGIRAIRRDSFALRHTDGLQ